MSRIETDPNLQVCPDFSSLHGPLRNKLISTANTSFWSTKCARCERHAALDRKNEGFNISIIDNDLLAKITCDATLLEVRNFPLSPWCDWLLFTLPFPYFPPFLTSLHHRSASPCCVHHFSPHHHITSFLHPPHVLYITPLTFCASPASCFVHHPLRITASLHHPTFNCFIRRGWGANSSPPSIILPGAARLSPTHPTLKIDISARSLCTAIANIPRKPAPQHVFPVASACTLCLSRHRHDTFRCSHTTSEDLRWQRRILSLPIISHPIPGPHSGWCPLLLWCQLRCPHQHQHCPLAGLESHPWMGTGWQEHRLWGSHHLQTTCQALREALTSKSSVTTLASLRDGGKDTAKTCRSTMSSDASTRGMYTASPTLLATPPGVSTPCAPSVQSSSLSSLTSTPPSYKLSGTLLVAILLHSPHPKPPWNASTRLQTCQDFELKLLVE